MNDETYEQPHALKSVPNETVATNIPPVNDPALLDACFRRAVELIWCDPNERTCGEIKKQLMEEFSVKTVANMLRRIDPQLVKNL